ncbi:MAG: hypothetical protein GVX90_01320 [Alphaproteobacteria bacterium]|nr:hypothetical protein [Alphaproteobacteria bacterium]
MADHFAFIVSGGRTGTRFLGELLSEAIDDCHSEHEPDVVYGLDARSLRNLRRFGLWHAVIGKALGRSGVRVLGTRYLSGRIDLAQTARRLRSQRRAYHRSIEQSLLVESYYAWWMVARHLNEIFEGSRVIGIVRDPRDWIASWQSHSPGRGGGHLSHLFPPGPLTPAVLHDREWIDAWPKLGEVGRLAWQWRTINRTILEARTGGGVRIFRFEDVFDPESQALVELVKAASTFEDRQFPSRDMRHMLADKRNSSARTTCEWQAWSASERQQFNDICGPLLDKFGYEGI